MWLAQYLFGMLIGYYLLSPRLRHFINGLILRIFRKTPPDNTGLNSTPIDDTDPRITIKKVENTPENNYNQKRGIEVKEGDLAKWLEENPDLLERNK